VSFVQFKDQIHLLFNTFTRQAVKAKQNQINSYFQLKIKTKLFKSSLNFYFLAHEQTHACTCARALASRPEGYWR